MDRRRPIGLGALLLGLAVGCGVLAGLLHHQATTSVWTYGWFAYENGVTSYGPAGPRPGATTEVLVVGVAAVLLAAVGAALVVGALRPRARAASR